MFCVPTQERGNEDDKGSQGQTPMSALFDLPEGFFTAFPMTRGGRSKSKFTTDEAD